MLVPLARWPPATSYRMPRVIPSPEPGGAGGDGEVVALVGMEARPG